MALTTENAIAKRLTADLDLGGSGGALQSVTDLDLVVTNGQEIYFQYTLRYTAGNNIGMRCGINSTGTGTLCIGSIQANATTAANFASITALNTVIFAATAGVTTAEVAMISGTFLPTQDGTLTFKACNEGSGAMVLNQGTSALFFTTRTQTPATFPLSFALDSGTGGDANPITGNWTPKIASDAADLKRLSNKFAGTAAGNSSAYWNPATYSPANGVEVYVKVDTLPGGADDVGLWIITNTSIGGATIDGYFLTFTATGGRVRRQDKYVDQTIVTVTQALSAGDSIGMSLYSGNLTVWYKSGAGAWTAIGYATDTSYTAAMNIGISIRNTTGRMSTFGGGEPANPITVTPGIIALTITTYAPSVLTPRLVTPDTKALTLTTYAPVVTALQGAMVVPTTKALVLATFAPTVTAPNPILVVPDIRALVLTKYAPTITTPQRVVPDTKALILTTYAPVVTAVASITVVPDTKALTLTTYVPIVSTPQHVVPTTKSLVLTTYAPTVLTPQLVTPDMLEFILTSYDPLVFTARLITPDTATLTLTTYDPTVTGGGVTLNEPPFTLAMMGYGR